MLNNYLLNDNYDGWQPTNDLFVPNGYECRLFPHRGLMIRKKSLINDDWINPIDLEKMSENMKIFNPDKK